MKRTFLGICIALSAFAAIGAPSQARAWKPQGAALAQDYAVITDTRADHDIVILSWFASPLAASAPNAEAAQAMLDKYIIIGAVHGHIGTGGAVSFDTTDTLQALDADKKPLTLLEGDKIPPMVAGSVSLLGAMMRQSIGAMGQGMRFFVFDAGDVHACGKGQLAVPYAGETYTYDTPIPGCPAP